MALFGSKKEPRTTRITESARFKLVPRKDGDAPLPQQIADLGAQGKGYARLAPMSWRPT